MITSSGRSHYCMNVHGASLPLFPILMPCPVTSPATMDQGSTYMLISTTQLYQFTAKGKFYPNFALHYSIHILCPITPLHLWCRAPFYHIVWTACVAGYTISPLMWGSLSWPCLHWKGKAGMVAVLKTYNFIFVIIWNNTYSRIYVIIIQYGKNKK